jgi:cold shock CspA family protein
MADVAPHVTGVHGLHVGTVAWFDVEVGLGEVETADGRLFGFHCTAIAGGSRRIDPGTRVGFRVGAGGPGRWEAFELTPTG